ncbi:hypothetical protein AB0M44_23075 [Streptosporangium subroseum]|uniref:hypothetical protein n=1 Tax=Streptosporangium subroseum TaxID=106412 RepID=UPI0034234B88
MLSDGWIQEGAQEPVPNVGDRVILHLDGSREIISPDGSRKIIHLDEYRDTSEFSRVDAHTGAQDSAQVRSFLGSGWREDLDLPDERRHKGKRKSRLLLAAVGGIVTVGLASGWMMSSPTGTTPGTSCSSGAQCTTAEHPEQPSESPTAQPEETTDPSVTVKPTTVPRVRESHTSDPRPTVTRSSAPPPRPSPTRQREESSSHNLDPESETPDRPAPSPTKPAKPAKPSESAPPAESAAPTQEPTSGGNPSPSEPPKRGGLLDWLF